MNLMYEDAEVSVFQIHFGKPVPWLQQVLHHVNTLHFEILGVYELNESFEISTLRPSLELGKCWTGILLPQDVPTVQLSAFLEQFCQLLLN